MTTLPSDIAKTVSASTAKPSVAGVNGLSSRGNLLAVDVGFALTGAVVFSYVTDHWRSIKGYAIPSEPPGSITTLYKAHADATRMQMTAARLRDIMQEWDINKIVVEIPGAGANDFRAGRAMALATGMIAAVVGCSYVAVEWYSPEQTRDAALGKGWRKRRLSTTALKDAVITAMAHHACVQEQPTKEYRAAVADALATFEAAKSGNLVKL